MSEDHPAAPSLKVAVVRESAPGERRVALVPASIPLLVRAGCQVFVEAGAGAAAGYLDAAYAEKGASLAASRNEAFAADVLLAVRTAGANLQTGRDDLARFRPGQIVIGMANPLGEPAAVAELAARGVTLFALEMLPRITRAQAMDVLSSQANLAGYRAVIEGAGAFQRGFPMMMTAAGTIRPAKTLILGAGVAGLVAISTARRLGSVVEAYDVRRAAGEQVRSLGAKFLELQINAEGQGGYARELTDDEKKQEREMLAQAIGGADVVITTANIPGRKAPLLVPTAMVEGMRPGSVIVDLAAESGGNCELTRPGEEVHYHDVTIAGPLNLPSSLPYHASEMYAKNLESFLGLLITKDHTLVTEYSDEILAASLLTVGGEIRHAPTRDAIGGAK